MNKEKEKVSLTVLIVAIIAAWIIITVIIWFVFKDWDKSGTFGDTFGAINSLFSGLALAGIIYTIYLQKTELSLQRKELEYTREELKRTADAQESSSKMMTEQLRINNMPILQLECKYQHEILPIGVEINPSNLIISNKSDNNSFDIEIWLFISVNNADYNLSDFFKSQIKTDYQDLDSFTEEDLLDEEWFFIFDRGIYDYLSSSNSIKIRLDDYPVDVEYFYVVLQYRDVVGNNYCQFLFFANSKSQSTPYIRSTSYPTTPKTLERFKYKESCPPELGYLNQMMKCSFNYRYFEGVDIFFVEKRWDM